MSNNFFRNLSIDIPVFENEKDLIQYQKNGHSVVPIGAINPKLHSFFNSLGLSIPFAASFYRGPSNSSTEAHRDFDNTGLTDIIKINWIFNGKDSTMDWYKPLPNTIKKKLITPGANLVSTKHSFDEVELVFSGQPSSPCMVQVADFHGVTMGDNNDTRQCISLHVKKIATGELLSFKDGLEVFKNYLAH